MPISFGGVYLGVDSPSVRAWWEFAAPLDEVEVFDPPFRPLLKYPQIQTPNLFSPPMRPGTLYWPQGAANHAVGFYVISQSVKDELDALPMFSSSGPTPYDLVIDDEYTSISFEMYALPPHPVSAEITGEDRLWILTLVDERYFWWRKPLSVTVTEGVTTWEDLIEACADALDVTITPDAVHAGYLTPTNRFTNDDYTPLPLYLDAVLAQIQHRLIRERDGTLRTESAATANANHGLNLSGSGSGDCLLAGGGYADDDVRRSVPASATCVFQRTSSGTYTVDVNLVDLSLAEYAGIAGHFGKTRIIYMDRRATSGTPPGNIADLQVVAVRTATDYYLWQATEADWSYGCVVDWTPTGNDGLIIWEWSASEERVRTRAMKPPWDGAEQSFPSESPMTTAEQSAVILALDAVEEFVNVAACSGVGESSGPPCPTRLHLGMLQTYDENCDAWIDDRCVWLGEYQGRFLKYGHRYRAWPEPFPTNLQAIPLDPDAPCPGAPDELWMTNMGEPSRIFLVHSYVGRICAEAETGGGSGSGSGGGSGSGSGGGSVTIGSAATTCHVAQAEVYTGYAYVIDPEGCTWVRQDEQAYLIEKCGKQLPIGHRLEGHYHTVLHPSQLDGAVIPPPSSPPGPNPPPVIPPPPPPGEQDDPCLPLYVVECDGYTGLDTSVISILCLPHDDPEVCGSGNNTIGNLHYTFRQEFWTCGHLNQREVVSYILECCCELSCWPGVGNIDCEPCDVLAPGARPPTISGTIDTGGTCPCIDGTYEMVGTSNGWCARIEACETTWDLCLVCVGNTWYATFSCGPCAFEFNPDEDVPPPVCAIVNEATVSNCNAGAFSGSAGGGTLVCFEGQCVTVEVVDFTFTS